MAKPDYDHALAEELNKVGEEILCARYRHETNDEYGWRLVARIEDSIDAREVEIARLDELYHAVKSLL